jgi:hypothetical protein
VSGKQTEVRKLLQIAEAQRYTWEYTGSGHIMVTAPGGDKTFVASTPHSDRGLIDVRMRLKRIGVKFPVANKKRAAAPPPPPGDPVFIEPVPPAPAGDDPPGTDQEGTPVPKFSEIARVTGDGPAPRRDDTLMPISEIANNLPLAAYLVWQHIMDEIRSGAGDTRRHVLQGIEGWEWLGSRQGMITKAWPDLAPVDYDYDPPRMPAERRLLGAYLSGSRNMAVLRTGSRERKTLWWVRENWVEVPASGAMDLSHGGARQEDWWQRKVTPEEAGETREPARVTTLHRCPDCAFTTRSAASLGTHKAKLSGQQHPRGTWPCPVDGCPEVRGDTASLGNHVSRDHRALGLTVCRVCGSVFTSKAERSAHAARQHPTRVHVAVHDDTEVEVGAGPRVEPPVSVQPPAAVAPSAPQLSAEAGTQAPEDPATYLQRVINEAGQVPALRARISALEEENATLRERDDQVAAWLRAYPFRRDTE